MPNTIILKSYLNIYKERTVYSAIMPGMLVEPVAAATVKPHARATGNVLPVFAIEDALQGKGIDEAYAPGDKVRCWYPTRGDEVYAILEDGESVLPTDFLASAGNGRLKKHVTEMESWGVSEAGEVIVYPLQIVARALETKDLSGSSGEESSGLEGAQRIKVEIV